MCRTIQDEVDVYISNAFLYVVLFVAAFNPATKEPWDLPW